MPKIVSIEDHTLTQTQIAEMTGRSKEWVKKLAQEGVLERDGRGAYKLRSVCAAIVAHYETMTDRSARTQSAARAAEARAAEIEQRMAMRERSLIPLDEAIEEYDTLVAVARAELDSLPAAATRDMAQRQKLEALVHAAKNRIADALAAAHGAARAGEPAAGDTANDP